MHLFVPLLRVTSTTAPLSGAAGDAVGAIVEVVDVV